MGAATLEGQIVEELSGVLGDAYACLAMAKQHLTEAQATIDSPEAGMVAKHWAMCDRAYWKEVTANAESLVGEVLAEVKQYAA